MAGLPDGVAPEDYRDDRRLQNESEGGRVAPRIESI
jgi:hypothetical protein